MNYVKKLYSNSAGQTRPLQKVHTADNLFKIKLLQELQQSIKNLEVKIGQVIEIDMLHLLGTLLLLPVELILVAQKSLI